MATWVITGANRGLGLEFVKQLLGSGHQIIAGVRRIDSMPIRHEDLTVFALDVSSGDSVNQFAEQVRPSQTKSMYWSIMQDEWTDVGNPWTRSTQRFHSKS